MAKSKEKVVFTNNIDKAYMLEKRRKVELNKRIRANAWLLRLFFIAMLLAYSWSDYSKIMTISVYGNSAVSKESILELSGLDTQSFYYFFAPKYIELKIKRNPLIDNAKVTRQGDNIVRIDVEEKPVVASIIKDDSLKYLCVDSSIIDVDKSNLDYMSKVPYVSGLEDNDELLKILAKNLGEVDAETNALISEIVYYPISYDEYQLKLHMIDHNVIYIPMIHLGSINSYQKIVGALSENGVCIYFDSPSTQPYLGECISEAEADENADEGLESEEENREE